MKDVLNDDSLYRMVLDNLHEGVYVVDRDRCIKYWNKSSERITGFTAEDAVGRPCHANLLMHVDKEGTLLCKGKCPLAHTMEDGEPRQAQVYLRHKEGHRVPVYVSAMAVRDDTGKVIGAVEIFHNNEHVMSALAEVEHLREQALLCGLTGLGNRRYTDETLEKQLAAAKTDNTGLGLVIVDIDHFKGFNDKYGHAAGDLVLKMVARTIAGDMRAEDFVGRWGGEEFVAILPGMTRSELRQRADRLRALVQRSSRELSKGKLAVTISGGAALSRPHDTAKTLFERADKLLYDSKENGRNQVTMEKSGNLA